MVRVIVFLAMLISSSVSAQLNEKARAKACIDTFFEGFHKGDTTLIKSVIHENIFIQTAYKNKKGKDILVMDKSAKLINAIANRPLDQKWDERLLSYNIQIDDNIANVWTPYEFWINDEFSHCGVNSFQLFNQDGKWKIIYLIDTRRRQDCQ